MTAKENDKLDRLFEMTVRIDERTETLIEKQKTDDEHWVQYTPVLKQMPETIKTVNIHEQVLQKGKGILWLVTVGVSIVAGIIALYVKFS